MLSTLTCMSRIVSIGDLESGHFRHFPIRYKSMETNSNASNTHPICSNSSKPFSVRFLLMTSV